MKALAFLLFEEIPEMTVPIQGKGQRKGAPAVLIADVLVEAYPEWWRNGEAYNDPSAEDKWARLQERFCHQQVNQGSYYGSYLFDYPGARRTDAIKLNRFLQLLAQCAAAENELNTFCQGNYRKEPFQIMEDFKFPEL